jgi:fatty-acyl-CoA synthase
MGSSAAKLEGASLEQTIRENVAQLVRELGNPQAVEELNRKGGEAHLERDLGLGSLERVELMLRLDKAFSIQLPESVVGDATSVSDLLAAVLRQFSGQFSEQGVRETETERARAPLIHIRGGEKNRDDLTARLAAAESLAEIISIRGTYDAETAHIYLYEDGQKLRVITCGELYARALSVAKELGKRGIEPGHTVAIMLPTGAEFFWTFAGTMMTGAIPVPIYPPFRADRIGEYAERQSAILANAGARMLITFQRAEGVANLLRPRVKTLRDVVTAENLSSSHSATLQQSEMQPIEPIRHRSRSEDIAFLQYTSGSTGNPKGVVLTHANLLANIRSITQALKLNADDVAVSWLPLYHDMGLIGAWFVPLATGVPLVSLSPLAFLSRPVRWLEAISHHRGTLSPAPNFAYELCVRKIADEDLKDIDLSCWRAALNGAETVRMETINKFAEKFARCGFRREALLPVYGLAEASLGVSAPAMGSGAHADRIDRAVFESEKRAIRTGNEGGSALEFVSVGQPLPGMEVSIVDDAGNAVPERIEGRVHFRGPSTTAGYYKNPEATRELVLGDGWLESGDLGYVVDGELYLTGRKKDLIIKGGRNLYPHEIEAIVGRVAGVRTGCVVAFGAPDEASGTEKLVVVAEARDQTRAGELATEITRAVSESVGVPPDIVRIVPVHSIPKTSSGKLRRSETRRLYLESKLGEAPAPQWLQIARLGMRAAFPRFAAVMKKGFLRGAEIIYGVYALALFGAAAAIVCVIVYPMKSRLASAKIIRRASRMLLFLVAIRVEIHGRELLDEWRLCGPWIFAPNHSSYLDILISLASLPAEVRYVAKGEIASMPLVATMAKRSGHFAFDRSDANARVAQSEEVERALRRGESVVIYPEGTFTLQTGVRPFQLGAFKAAVDTGRAICPIAVRGARELLRDETYLPKPGKVEMTVGPLIVPRAGAGNWQEIVRLRDETREVISRGAAEPLL